MTRLLVCRLLQCTRFGYRDMHSACRTAVLDSVFALVESLRAKQAVPFLIRNIGPHFDQLGLLFPIPPITPGPAVYASLVPPRPAEPFGTELVVRGKFLFLTIDAILRGNTVMRKW